LGEPFSRPPTVAFVTTDFAKTFSQLLAQRNMSDFFSLLLCRVMFFFLCMLASGHGGGVSPRKAGSAQRGVVHVLLEDKQHRRRGLRQGDQALEGACARSRLSRRACSKHFSTGYLQGGPDGESCRAYPRDVSRPLEKKRRPLWCCGRCVVTDATCSLVVARTGRSRRSTVAVCRPAAPAHLCPPCVFVPWWDRPATTSLFSAERKMSPSTRWTLERSRRSASCSRRPTM